MPPTSSVTSIPTSRRASVRSLVPRLPLVRPGRVSVGVGGAFSRALLLARLLGEPVSGRVIVCFATPDDLAALSKLWPSVSDARAVTVDSVEAVARMLETDEGCFFVAHSLFRGMPPRAYDRARMNFTLSRGQKIRPADAIDVLIGLGYRHDPSTGEAGTYRQDGDTLHVWGYGERAVASVSYFDDEIDDIMSRDPFTGAIRTVWRSTFARSPDLPVTPLDTQAFGTAAVEDWHEYFPTDTLVCFDSEFLPDFSAIRGLFGAWYALAESSTETALVDPVGIRPLAPDSLDALVTLARERPGNVWFAVRQARGVERFASYNDLSIAGVIETALPKLESWELGDGGIAVVTDVIASRLLLAPGHRSRGAKDLDLLLSIDPGDLVVHVDHGIGRYEGRNPKTVAGVEREYLRIAYADGGVLHVPIEDAYRLTKYVGKDNAQMARLGGAEWGKQIAKAEADVEQIAHEILENHARRSLSRGFPFVPFAEKELAFRLDFKFPHTDDQARAIEEILADMALDRPMDRLLTGDVGFGKTEVALNAAYRAFLNGKQTVFLSPLVVLAYDHYETATRRLGGTGMRVAILTRLTPESEAKRVVSAIRSGGVDLVIGTHRLLSPDLRYANLGLLVVDEEHKFGVMDKERIHAIRAGIDTLSLSATPIPRSLNFALSGMKELSVLATPPRAKKPIRTVVAPTDFATLAEAVSVELARGGQILAVTPRIMSMGPIREMLRSVAPELRIIETHGELPGTELEDRIVDFRERKYDCLLSTTVIENGVNFLAANTVVIFDSDHFGLAQLHQLRGRVGRADVEGRCYLLYPPEGLSAESKHRLSTLVAHSHLGAGFEIAMRDLQIRGAGDILGVRQSGHANEVGLSLYLQLLETRVKELRHDPDVRKKTRPVTIDLAVASYVPDEFFGSEADKLAFFRNLESLETEEDLRAAWRHFSSLADEIPSELENLFLLLAARISFARLGIERVRKILDSYAVDWYADATNIPAMKEFLERDRRSVGTVASATRLKFRARAFKSDRDFLAALVPEFGEIIKMTAS